MPGNQPFTASFAWLGDFECLGWILGRLSNSSELKEILDVFYTNLSSATVRAEEICENGKKSVQEQNMTFLGITFLTVKQKQESIRGTSLSVPGVMTKR